jgi:hypothetical protein
METKTIVLLALLLAAIVGLGGCITTIQPGGSSVGLAMASTPAPPPAMNSILTNGTENTSINSTNSTANSSG